MFMLEFVVEFNIEIVPNFTSDKLILRLSPPIDIQTSGSISINVEDHLLCYLQIFYITLAVDLQNF